MSDTSTTDRSRTAPDFLRDGGEMGGLMRAFDWSSTPLGPPERWPDALRLPVALLLNSRQPMYIWWGPELLCFYNDAYRRSIGSERHPGSLGRPAREVWAEIWHIIGPQISQIMAGHGGTEHENALVPITRNGRLEDVYWNYTYSPIFDPAAVTRVGGVLVVCTETTAQVLSAQRAADERHQIGQLFEQAPIFMAMLRGPEHRFELVNPAYRQLVGHRDLLGRRVAEAIPEAVTQGFIALLDTVFAGGEPYAATGLPFNVQRSPDSPPDNRYLDFVYQPIKDSMGAVTGVCVVGVDSTDRTLAEAAHRESEARFRDIADAAPVLMWISDVTKTCIWFNSRWLSFTGRSMAQETGYGWVDGIHPEDVARCADVYDRAFDRREFYRTQYRRRRWDGEWRLLDATGVPRMVDGVFVGYIGSCLDVTEQQAAVRALSDREEQMRLASEAAEVGFWDLDVLTDTLFWPARVKAMFGIAADEAISMRDFYAGLHPDDYARTVAAFGVAVDPLQRGLYDVEYRTVGKNDGIIRWVAAKGRALFRGERCVRVLGTALDITTRKAAEAELRELNERLEQRVADALAERKVFADIVEATDALVQVVDLDYRFLAVNRASAAQFARNFGVHPKVGDSMLALLAHRPLQLDAVQSIWSRALAGEEFTLVDTVEDPAVERRYYEMKFNCLRDRDGRLVGAFQFVYDVTDRLRDQARLAEAEKRLRQSQKIDAIGQLTGGVAHDFNNLLMVVSGGLSLLQRADDPQRRLRIMEQMRQAADRGASLSRQLLAFARRRPLNAEPVDLRRQLGGMRELLDRTLRGDVQVITELPDDVWPILVDPAELELVVINLCVNARDAMPDGGRITIAARNLAQLREDELAGDFVELSVLDTGTGMSAEVLSHVFEPFFTTKEIGKGSGLGLPQVYGFAQQSGGAVKVRSAPGRGTAVTLLLPRSTALPAPADTPHVDNTARRRALAGSILLVEDDDEVAALVTEMLRELGYHVTRVASAQAALGALADDRDINLVFSDIMMPGSMSGVQLVREVRRRRPGLPVLLTSGYSGTASGDADTERIGVLHKPYDIQALDAALRVALQTA